MRGGLRPWVIGALTAVSVGAAVAFLVSNSGNTAHGQMLASVPRAADGKPDFSGVWQALNAANWDLLNHAARPSPVTALGARGAVPAGVGVVEGNEIPYQDASRSVQKDNFANWLLRDPTIKCFLPGVPRATYMPFPFQIVQGARDMLIAYEFADASRVIYMNSKEESPVDTWMGWSRGHWEGDTLVVDVTSFNDQTWFDSAGNYHSDALHVVERYTATSPNHLLYEALIEDPKVFTRPWKIKMPLYRRMEDDARVLEFKCVEFAEEVVYGHLRKKKSSN
jgi:hypothetical protein